MTAARAMLAVVPALVAAGAASGPRNACAQEPGAPQPPAGRSVGDPQGLSVGVPVRIQDALVTLYGEAIFQAISSSTYVGRHGNGVSSPLLGIAKFGVAPGLGINLSIAKNLGDAGHAGTTVTPSFQYVLNESHGYVPGLSVEGTYSPRPGTGLSGGTWGLSGQATQYFGPSTESPRLHLNVEWNKVNDESRRARPDTFGYGVGLSDRTALVGDVFYSQRAARHDSQTFVYLGPNYLVGPRLALSADGASALTGPRRRSACPPRSVSSTSGGSVRVSIQGDYPCPTPSPATSSLPP